MKIEFKDVGRDKKSWTANVSKLDHASLYRAVKKAGALRSRDVDFGMEMTDGWGRIFAGFQCVGSWRIAHLDVCAAPMKEKP